MAYGYRLTIHSPLDEMVQQSLMCGESLEGELEQLTTFLREWLTRPIQSEHGENVQHLSLSLMGPFPESQLRNMGMTAEELLAEAETEDDRFQLLGSAAKSRFDEGDTALAISYARELEALARQRPDHPLHGDAVATVNTVLGRVALVEGRREDAIAHLRAAGQVSGSPTLCSFGPNMSLARDLLLSGEADAVLEHLEDCRSFWEMGSDDLDTWREDIRIGRLPDFGANLVY